MYRLILKAIATVLIVLWATLAQADVIFQSATFNHTSCCGPDLWLGEDKQLAGARFVLTTPAHVDAVGGNLASGIINPPSDSKPLFAAIVSLDGPAGLPNSTPLDAAEVIRTATFIAPALGADLTIPLHAMLQPGDYGLVFGSGLFGSPVTARALMVGNNGDYYNTDIPGSASYFVWTVPNGWRDGSCCNLNNMRFVVYGEVHEPSTLLLLGSGLIGLAGLAWRRKRQ